MTETNITLKKRSWNDISISDWRKISEICKEESLSDVEKNVEVLAVLCDCTPDDVWNTEMAQLNKLMDGIGWLNSFNFNKKWSADSIKINGKKYKICTNVAEFSVAQYIDFQELWKKRDGNEGRILACFIIPEGCRYGEGYDVVELANLFEQRVSITNYNAVCFFFLKQSLLLTRISAAYLEWQMKRMKRKVKKHPEMAAKIAEMQREMERIASMVG